MEFIEFLKYVLKGAAVTILPAFLIWWWNGSTRRNQQTYKMYFWMFFIAVGLFGVGFNLITTGNLNLGAFGGQSDY